MAGKRAGQNGHSDKHIHMILSAEDELLLHRLTIQVAQQLRLSRVTRTQVVAMALRCLAQQYIRDEAPRTEPN